MRPVVSVAEMREVDERAAAPVEVLIDRAGRAVASAALQLLGGGYGRRVVVVAGKGNNGADGRAAARRLGARGVRCQVVDAASAPERLPACDLVIDAAYGTGFHGSYRAPAPDGTPVLAVDIASGLDGDTGAADPDAVVADATVTFAALKPGLLLGNGPDHTGHVDVADIGLDVGVARAHLVDDSDVAALLPHRSRIAHKWQTAVRIIAGSPGMTGAATLAARAAMRAGAGYVRLGVPGGDPEAAFGPPEVVSDALPADGWAACVLDDIERFAAVVVGPGLGRSDDTLGEVRRLVARCPVPVVVDADALVAFAGADHTWLNARVAATVLTPHAGEFARLASEEVWADRLGHTRALSARLQATLLLKGPTTVVADPDGGALLCTSGAARLATAGTGDVLSGMIGALLAGGLAPGLAAALGAHVHGRAAQLGPAIGLVAGDLPDLIARWLSVEAGP